ncbi:DUF4233 domain-containing protein [Agromyces sp. SYSU K20354]|uniref:DUF4233 domain-containing protein n=1 Tax=Agromyces cavernae TaxID=2898659 RepID=UPI001E5C16F8|nr:DUF4233 domain-containing protein [Agromyces cavernae]MCD2442224.1 DUF4233 domain-containing protein [Agromyces cavernae]
MTAPEPSEPTPETPDDATAQQARPARPARSLRQSLAAVILACEALIVFLAALVIWGLAQGEPAGVLPSWVALAAGGVIIVALIVTIGLLRHRWAYALGWTLQLLILASGFLNPAMFVVGVIFGGMWWYAMVVGARIDRQHAADAAAGKEQQ